MKRKYIKDIKPYLFSYVFLSAGTLFMVAQTMQGDGPFSFGIQIVIWFIYWFILSGVFGYIIKDRLQPKYKENILLGSFLLLHITSCFFFSFIIFLSDPFIYVLLMSFVMYFLIGLLFAGIPFYIGCRLASIKKQ